MSGYDLRLPIRRNPYTVRTADGAFISRILDADGEIVGDLRQASKPIADFLVRACNSHAKLLEACKALLDHFCGAGERTHTDASVMVLAQAAIAEAEADGA